MTYPLHLQVTGVLARRGYNVQSLAVGNCESAELSRITTVIPGSRESSSKVIKQLLKLIHVHSVTDLSDLPFICDVSRTTITLEIQGKEQKMRAVQDLLEPYGEHPSPHLIKQNLLYGKVYAHLLMLQWKL